jgi:endonuclease YncB( thermonuclease family)
VRQTKPTSNVIPFRRVHTRRRRPSYRVPIATPLLFALLLGFVAASGVLNEPGEENAAGPAAPEPIAAAPSKAPGSQSRSFTRVIFAGRERSDIVEESSPPETADGQSGSFTMCGAGPRINCVVDGDTFWRNGRKIRISDIDTPEIHPSRCDREEQLGQAAKQRLLELLNAGPVELQSSGRDRYGRDLREIIRNGASLGDQLIREGLARRWDGHRRPWCE